MEQLREHLDSPQFTDREGNATGSARFALMVAPGKPRWLGYLFYLITFLISAVLALGLIDVGGEMGADLVRILGVVGMLGAVYGAWEVWYGRTLSLGHVIDRIRGR